MTLHPEFTDFFMIIQVHISDRYLLKSMTTKWIYKYPHDRIRKARDHQVPKELDLQLDNGYHSNDD